MIGRMLIKDFLRNKVITVALFIFIMLAVLLTTGAVGIIAELSGAVDNLFAKASIPHFVQMHAGEFNQKNIDMFTAEHGGLIKSRQTAELLNINGGNIYLGENQTSEAASVMENAFVKQNPYFDFLLDMDNRVLQIKDGEIAVPVYHMQQYDLKKGDTVTVQKAEFSMEFTIVDFVRDAQMNPSIITSKRFVISDKDWETLAEAMGEIEYLIEFQLYDESRAGEIESLYQSAGLPQTGTAVTHQLYRLMNFVTDGVVAAVIILISILLVAIAALCLRFTMITTIEEDYREIGIMKAMGIRNKDIQRLYLTKYVLLATSAGICGYLSAQLFSHVFTANVTLYMGNAEKNIWHSILPAAGAVLVSLTVIGFCRLVLRRFRRISAVEAIRAGHSQGGRRPLIDIKLYKSNFPNVNILLGAREVLGRFRVYGLLCFVFILCSFLMIVPLNTLTTVESPEFTTYMGAGKSHMRIDLQKAGDMEIRFNDMMSTIQGDPDIEKYSALITATYQAQNPEGLYDSIKVEIGDFSAFPLSYYRGEAPGLENEIALSVLNADEFQKSVGDKLTVLVGGEPRRLTVCGIYQDVTNGGRTAKAILPYDPGNILWYTVNLNLKDQEDISRKIEEYAAAFYPAKVTDIDDYMAQTLGSITEQLRLAVLFASGIATGIAILITALFFKMLMAKDALQISIMRRLGFSTGDISTQYMTRALVILAVGILAGTLAAGTFGRTLASAIMPGVASVNFIVNPFMAYILCPGVLMAAVTITIWISGVSMKKASSFERATE